VVPGAGGAAFLEVKEGPYDPATAVEFAAWAPPRVTRGAEVSSSGYAARSRGHAAGLSFRSASRAVARQSLLPVSYLSSCLPS